MRLHTLDQGFIEAQDAVFLPAEGAPELVSTRWPVRCYLVEHPRGWLLWDAGLPEAPLAAGPLALGGWPKGITAPLLPWLAGFGLAPSDIAYAGFSHLHVDHLVPEDPQRQIGRADGVAGRRDRRQVGRRLPFFGQPLTAAAVHQADVPMPMEREAT